MTKYCAENERVKRAYVLFVEAASGRQSATADAALRAIARFETSTQWKPFKRFHIEQVRSFRADLAEEVGPGGKPLSAATIGSTLKHLRNFFLWLSREHGYRSNVNANDAAHFTPTEHVLRIATARREGPVATLDEVKRVLFLMPSRNPIERRNRALIAFALLSGCRDGALASLRIKHVNVAEQTVFQDARTVLTKGRKTFTSSFYLVGPEPVAIFVEYLEMLERDFDFRADDPVFPATRIGQNSTKCFEPQGLTRAPWSDASPIRRIFRDAFAGCGTSLLKPALDS